MTGLSLFLLKKRNKKETISTYKISKAIGHYENSIDIITTTTLSKEFVNTIGADIN